MKSFTTLFGIAALANTSALAQLTIHTPATVVQCQPVLLSWTGRQGNNPTGAPLEDLGVQTGHTFTWTVDIPAGTSVGFEIRDSTGVIENSAPVIVQPSSDSSCL
ncbi:hypothetical protein C8J56DRAFT_1039636 [Mycena floridula]|nr:hypothetical protein C8J56DRAFT_1039636 [Mycena floridula]